MIALLRIHATVRLRYRVWKLRALCWLLVRLRDKRDRMDARDVAYRRARPE